MRTYATYLDHNKVQHAVHEAYHAKPRPIDRRLSGYLYSLIALATDALYVIYFLMFMKIFRKIAKAYSHQISYISQCVGALATSFL